MARLPGPTGPARLLRATSLTVRGGGVLLTALVLLAVGVAARWWTVAGVGAALLLLVLVEVAAVRGDRRTVATRRVEPLVVHRGSPARCTVEADLAPSRIPLRRIAVDLVDGDPRPVELALGRGGAHVRVGYDIETPRRGLVLVGPLVIRSTATLGLAAVTSDVGMTRQLRVLPRPARVDALPRGSRRAATGQDERVEHGGTDLVGLHEYVPGDDLRRLHWASSARTGVLMVRDDADPAVPHVLVILDDRSGSYGAREHAEESFEEAVDFAAGLVERALGEGRHVRLQAVSGLVDVDVEARPATVAAAPDSRITHALAEVALVDTVHVAAGSTRDLDIAVLVTGTGVEPAEAAGLLATSSLPVVAQVDPAPESRFGAVGTVDAVRAATAPQLASAWAVTHG
ncbi:MAG: DUF58 domain-containing protein [Dermatophilaceae bacterium]